MAEEEIISKLNIFLKNHSTFKEECEVAYLMVEVRKILDHKNNGKYSLLRFYCDWMLHIRKDRITEEMKKIMTELYEIIKKDIETKCYVGKDAIKFIYFKQLRKEMAEFFTEINLFDDLVKKDELWLSFIKLFVKILENQPIIFKPESEIKLFSFISSAERAVAYRVEFKNKIIGKNKKEYDYFRFVDWEAFHGQGIKI